VLIVRIASYGSERFTHRKAGEKYTRSKSDENQLRLSKILKILGIHIVDKMRNEVIRVAVNLTVTIMQTAQHKWLGPATYIIWTGHSCR